MKICQLAPLWKAVPPLKYGGSELIVNLLSEELVRLGHEVTLIAAGGSLTSGKLIEIIPQPLYEELGHFDFDHVQFAEVLAIVNALRLAEEGKVELIHNHMGFTAAAFARFCKVPWVTTIHSSLSPDYEALAYEAKDANYVSISQAQRRNAPYLNFVDNIYHGIDVDSFKFESETGAYLAYMATMRNEKGADRAIQISLETKMPLIMAGDIRADEDWQQLKPHIDGDQIKYLGELDFRQKNELLKNAKAYLFPIRWNEAFGLSVVESLSCGTPVIAWPNGSIPEIIEHGVDGFIVDSLAKAVDAVSQVAEISRFDCRKSAEERFDMSIMARNYQKLYEEIAV